MLIHDYQTALTMSQSHKRKLANNTHLDCDNAPDSFAIRLYSTNIVTYFKDGRVVLNSGGWQTIITKARFNEFSDSLTYCRNGIFYTSYNGLTYPFADGLTMYSNGKVTGYNKSIKGDTLLREKVKAYAKAYVEELLASKIPAPSNVDCWGCLVQTKEGEHPMGERDHILNHIKQRHYVPSLSFNACKAFGASRVTMHNLSCIVTGKMHKQITVDSYKDIEKCIVRWCYRELGMSF